jgi:hypothetical protein
MWWRGLVGAVVRRRDFALARVVVLVAAGFIAAGFVIACLVLVAPGTAVAATGHRFEFSLSEASPGTKLVEPVALAVDHSSGQVFVGDSGSGMVDRYSSAGAYEGQFGGGTLGVAGIAVDEANRDVYVAEAFGDVIDVFKPKSAGGYELASEWTGANTPDEGFGEVTGVAIDNSTNPADPRAGDVYVVDGGDNVVDVFKPQPSGSEETSEGDFVAALTNAKLETPNGAVVDSASGEVYVADSVTGIVFVYSDAGTLERKVEGAGSPNGKFFGKEEEEGNVAAVAVDEASGELYVAEPDRHVVSQFNAASEWIGWITATPGGPLEEPRALAIGPNGQVYVSDTPARVVDVFGPDVTVPDAETDAALKISKTSATLNGVVNGDGLAAKYSFQWGESETLGQETAVQGAGSGEERVADEVGGLKAGRTYYFRLKTENANGANYGAIMEFTTKPAVETLATGAVTGLEPTEATLTGTLNPMGIETHYYFEWGTSTTYTSRSPEPPGDAGAGKKALEVKTTVTGLQPNTIYHYRLRGENELGATLGEDRHFTTSGPPSITPEPATVEGHEAATLHTRIDPGELETKYHFEYGETTSYGSEAPFGGGSIAPGEVAVAESAPLTHLRIGTTYHFRVVASNRGGTEYGPDQTFTTVPPALIASESVAEITGTSATLQTEIDPLGHETSYHFQYGTESCQANPESCSDLPAPPGGAIGSGESDVPESVQLQQLAPGTTYYYRVLATNSLGTAAGAQHTFKTRQVAGAFALPDGRAWEMVSPPNKHGAPIEALTREGGVILAAEDGDSITYVADGSITEEAQGNRSPEVQQVISTRGAEGWTSQDIATPNTVPQGADIGAAPEYQFFTPNLSLALVEPWGDTAFSEPPLAPEARQKTMYLRDDEDGAYLPLVTESNVARGTTFGHELHFVGATPDLSHVVLRSEVALTGPSSGPGLYEWSAGALQLVSVLPQEDKPAREAALGYAHVPANAISSDGTRIVWTDSRESRGHLYMRDTATGETVQLDAAQEGLTEPGAGAAQFQTANTEGTRVFFTDKEQLTRETSAEPAGEKSDLYECEMTQRNGRLACDLKDLTVDHNAGQPTAVQGFVLGASEGGTQLYLVAQGVLADNENGNGEHAEAGRDNLYELQYDGKEWTRTFIATLSSEDSPEWSDTVPDTASLTARVSPDGQYLAFMSSASLTGYDNIDQNSGTRDEEVYLYDADGSSLRCVSCNPSGGRPVGVLDTVESGEGLGLLVDRRKVWVGHWLAGNIPGWTAQSIESALFQSRYLSNEGRLFFNSADPLVAGVATRTRKEHIGNAEVEVGVENVYEYEPEGMGSCQSPSGGCVALISSGSSDRESAFLEATPSGDDAFFLTAAQLVPQDTDTADDVYDARVCTQASPCLTPPSPPLPGCNNADACHPASLAQPGALGSAGTAGGQSAAVPPHSGAGTLAAKASKPKPPTRVQELAAALQSCRKRYPRSGKKRARCEAQARRRYAVKKPKAHKTGKQNQKARRSSSVRTSGRRGR